MAPLILKVSTKWGRVVRYNSIHG